jgi:hypothetical protein
MRTQIASHAGVPAELVAAGQPRGSPPCATARSTACAMRRPSVLAPTGTIGLMMDCDTTGIEPDLGLVQDEEAGRWRHMTIVNQTIPRALRKLGYTPQQIDDIVAYIDGRRASSVPRTWLPSTLRCSPAAWATTPSTTKATCG